MKHLVSRLEITVCNCRYIPQSILRVLVSGDWAITIHWWIIVFLIKYILMYGMNQILNTWSMLHSAVTSDQAIICTYKTKIYCVFPDLQWSWKPMDHADWIACGQRLLLVNAVSYCSYHIVKVSVKWKCLASCVVGPRPGLSAYCL